MSDNNERKDQRKKSAYQQINSWRINELKSSKIINSDSNQYYPQRKRIKLLKIPIFSTSRCPSCHKGTGRSSWALFKISLVCFRNIYQWFPWQWLNIFILFLHELALNDFSRKEVERFRINNEYTFKCHIVIINELYVAQKMTWRDCLVSINTEWNHENTSVDQLEKSIHVKESVIPAQ